MRDRVMNRRAIGWVLDGLWLTALALYVFAGYRSVPFHGDESTIITMSRDYHALFQQRDLDSVLYHVTPQNPADQELRLLNGTVAKFTIGLAWDLDGLTVNALNQPWIWGLDWDQNAALGTIPGDRLLHAARIPSALFTALSVIAVFAIARIAARSRFAAWIASLVYATSPAVLLNGRRAMLEGSLLFFSALVVLAALLLIRNQQRATGRHGARWGWYAALGLASGLAVASKHSAVITVLAAFAAVLVTPALVRHRAPHPGRDDRRGFWRRHVIRLVGAGLLSLGVFLALNPTWWPDPVAMPGRVLDLREHLLDTQTEQFGSYDSAGDRLESLVDQTFFAGPQYYEDPMWASFAPFQRQIADYDSSWLRGRGGGPVWGVVLIALFVPGLVALFRARWNGAAITVLLWLGLNALALLVSNPLAWQRYYLVMQLPVAVIVGTGACWGWRTVVRRLRLMTWREVL